MKRVLALAAPLLFTGALLAYALWGVDLQSLGRVLVQAQLWVALPFLLLLVLFFVANALRWTMLLRPFGRFSLRQVAPAMMIGFAGNNVLPLRLGEIIRAVIFSRESGASRSGILMSLVVERALDLVGIAMVFAVGVLLMAEAPPVLVLGLWVALGGVGLLLLALILLARFPAVPMRFWDWMERFLPRPLAARGRIYLGEFARGLTVLRSSSMTLGLVLQSALRWGLAAVLVWLSLASYGVTLAPGLAMMVVGVLAAAVSLPSVPGFIGPIQAAFVFALTPFGVAQEVALAASILFLVGNWLPVTLTGAAYFVLHHYSYRELRREAAAVAKG